MTSGIRIIAGTARGRRITVPAEGTRPTSDRAREAFFSSLLAAVGPLAGMRVLDLYAGSGAVGIEALSRGADHALLVESDPRAAQTITANLAKLGLPGGQVRAAGVEDVVRSAPASGGYDVVFADPPYAMADEDVTATLVMAAGNGWFVDGSLIAVERARPLGWPPPFQEYRRRRYAVAWIDMALWYRHASPAAGGAMREEHP